MYQWHVPRPNRGLDKLVIAEPAEHQTEQDTGSCRPPGRRQRSSPHGKVARDILLAGDRARGTLAGARLLLAGAAARGQTCARLSRARPASCAEQSPDDPSPGVGDDEPVVTEVA